MTASVNWEVFRNHSQTVSERLKPNKGILFQVSHYIWYIYIEKKFKIAYKQGLSKQSYRCDPHDPKNPYPYPRKPTPVNTGMGFLGYRLGLSLNDLGVTHGNP
jgi:hypothetical protein